MSEFNKSFLYIEKDSFFKFYYFRDPWLIPCLNIGASLDLKTVVWDLPWKHVPEIQFLTVPAFPSFAQTQY